MMRGLNFRTGEMTPKLQGVINGVARVPGYMVPLEDNLEQVTEFLLAPIQARASTFRRPPESKWKATRRPKSGSRWRQCGAKARSGLLKQPRAMGRYRFLN